MSDRPSPPAGDPSGTGPRERPGTAPQPYRVDYGSDEAHRLALATAMAGTGLTGEQLWVRAFSLGAHIGLVDIEAYLEGLMPLPDLERDVLAQAMNERLAELAGPPPVPYSRTLRSPRPATGPLAALATLLEGARYCPPEQLAALATSAADALGVRSATLYLVDHQQRQLTQVAVEPDPGGQVSRVPLEGSMAGRAFRSGRTVAAVHDPPPRCWVPVLDGDERLGVLEVGLHSEDQLDDPHLREQCGWIAALLGHLAVSLDRHGDCVDAMRRAAPRSAGAELVWGLLPPLTAGVDDLVVSGLLAPADDLGGDVFDYALSQDTASLAVFDAMGHGLAAGVVAAAAVSAYRAARRAGRGLLEQADAVDATLHRLFPDAFVTAVLAEVNLRSGHVSYLNAGHPRPLLMRSGSVVAALADGCRLPLGLQHVDPAPQRPQPGRAGLEPGDWLALHTDGVTEARAADGTEFGDARLVDHLGCALAQEQPPPETVRRLMAAVLAHQDGRLQDDATLLLAQWRTAAAGGGASAGGGTRPSTDAPLP